MHKSSLNNLSNMTQYVSIYFNASSYVVWAVWASFQGISLTRINGFVFFVSYLNTLQV